MVVVSKSNIHMTKKLISLQTIHDMGWFFFLGLSFMYFWRARQITMQTKLWFKTRGRITHCEWTTYGHRVWPKIEYTYQVDDYDYTGELFFLDTVHTNLHSAYARSLAYRVVSAYKENEDIDVYYDPERPELAVLDTTIPWKLNLILGLITVLILIHISSVILRYFR